MYLRPPSPPFNVQMLVEGSSASNVTVSTSPVDLRVDWQVQSYDLNQQAEVRWIANGSQDGPNYAITDGSKFHERTISLNAGESKTLYANVRLFNGVVYSSLTGSNAITVTRSAPSIGTVYMTVNSYQDDILYIYWFPSNAPAGATYVINYRFDYNPSGWSTHVAPPGQTATTVYLSLASTGGYDIVDYYTGNTVTVEVEVQMWIDGNYSSSAFATTVYNLPNAA
jgi:hypothetical protein